jgi:very-short-patch-repair endonuclease
MHNNATATAQTNARALRAGMTESERRLWSRLRLEQLGVKFRRQHPVGKYIADFACLSPKLIVELDGSQHAEQREYDEARDGDLREQGFAVLRFATEQPFLNMDGVLSVIAAELAARSAPIPTFPRGGEGVNTRRYP